MSGSGPNDPAAAAPPAVPGQRFSLPGLNVYTTGSGPPLLLIHSVNAAASAAEVRPLFEQFSDGRTVYAPDLPGYGFSERPDIDYTPRLMTDAIHAVVHEIRRRHGGVPIDALAVSLACEFLARAADEKPADYRSLAFVSPTGFSGSRRLRGAPGSTRAMPWLHRALTGPGWGGALFRQLTKPGVIRYFLRRTFGAQQIDEALWRYAVITTRMPGAEHAPLHFLAGSLFSNDISDVYERLTLPVWVSHGVRGDFTDYRGVATVKQRPNWRITVLQTGAMPYFEVPAAFCNEYANFLRSVMEGPGS